MAMPWRWFISRLCLSRKSQNKTAPRIRLIKAPPAKACQAGSA